MGQSLTPSHPTSAPKHVAVAPAGGPAVPPPPSSIERQPEWNIASTLERRAEDSPQQIALHVPLRPGRGVPRDYTSITYAELAAESALLATQLQAHGIQPEMRTALMVPPSRELFALTFALFRLGAIPVFVDPGMGLKNLGQCLRESAPAAFVGVTKAHLARLVMRWGRRTIRQLVTVGPKFGWSGPTYQQLVASAAPTPTGGQAPLCPRVADDVAAILFTSGSTGVPKGAVYTHGVFHAQINALRAMFGIMPGEIDLCTFPLFALFAPALGMTAVIPHMDFTRPARVHPPNVLEPIRQFGVTNLFGSPALLDRVGRYAQEHPSEAAPLSSLKRVLSAGAPVAPSILKRFTPLLSEPAEIYTPYGATEALPVAWIGSREVLSDTMARSAGGAGICVGRPAPGIDIQIIRLLDQPIATWHPALAVRSGTIGEICVRGPQVTREYFQRPDHTALAKIADPQTGRWWHRMGDTGYFDEQGRLWFCGRKSQRVRSGAGTLFTDCCEGVFNQHPAVRRTALVGVRLAEGVVPVLCVELDPHSGRTAPRRQPQLISELLELGGQHEVTRGIHHVLFHPAFPVDIRHNSKIFREKLTVWAARELGGLV